MSYTEANLGQMTDLKSLNYAIACPDSPGPCSQILLTFDKTCNTHSHQPDDACSCNETKGMSASICQNLPAGRF